ncbi:hypothetical protein V5P93_003474 [Actinokineospora auranticolor]|uniref:Uncharacterized protein n=1 Tax=Actinokineospora auranticolor TaxID=155976 RepID=A0A2S6GPL6_9PSEU|nr:hypothetical protein [Actinokineospora auranticolor]PPK67137.1 hypothetical protein CLV40_108134 [Actinokineospora auranticolor]
MSNPAYLPHWQGGDPDAVYQNKILRHGQVETYFDETVLGRSLFRLFIKSFLIMILPTAILTSIDSTVGYSLMVPLWFAAFLLSRVAEPLGEWHVVLADRGAAADAVYRMMNGKIAERKLPIQSVETTRNRTGFGSVANRLVLIDGSYRAYVTVFAYGTSLYLGWVMYRHRRGVNLVVRFWLDLVARMTGRLSDIGQMLRTQRPRAMREVIHALCREGMYVAIERVEVPENYGFPNGLPPIEDLPGETPTGAGWASHVPQQTGSHQMPVHSAPPVPAPPPAPRPQQSGQHRAPGDPGGPGDQTMPTRGQ